MSKDETRMLWREFRLVRVRKGYTQAGIGKLLNKSQTWISLKETDHAEEYVEPEIARRVLEAPVAPAPVEVDAAERAPQPSSAPAPSEPAGRWPILFASGEPLPPDAWLAEMLAVVGSNPRQRVSIANLDGCPPPTWGGVGVVTAIPGGASENPSRSGTSAHQRFMGVLGLACLAVFGLTTGCMFSRRVPSEVGEPDRLRGQVYTENLEQQTPGSGLRRPSIPMPERAYSWQKVGPCDITHGEIELVGGCWLELKERAPCPRVAVDNAGRCLVPVPAEPKAPNTLTWQ